MFPSNLLTKVSGFLNNQADFINMHSLPCPDDTLKVLRRMVLTRLLKNGTTNDKQGPLNLSFLKQFLSEDDVPCVLIALNYQSTSNESNSACWNGLHLVFPSNFTNKSFRFLEQSG